MNSELPVDHLEDDLSPAIASPAAYDMRPIGSLTVKIHNAHGGQFEIQTSVQSTVGDLKASIESMRNIPITRQRLVFGGKEMEDLNVPVVQHEVQDGSSIFLVVSGSARPSPAVTPEPKDAKAADLSPSQSSQRSPPSQPEGHNTTKQFQSPQPRIPQPQPLVQQTWISVTGEPMIQLPQSQETQARELTRKSKINTLLIIIVSLFYIVDTIIYWTYLLINFPRLICLAFGLLGSRKFQSNLIFIFILYSCVEIFYAFIWLIVVSTQKKWLWALVEIFNFCLWCAWMWYNVKFYKLIKRSSLSVTQRAKQIVENTAVCV